jgi:CrcB protein
MNAWDWFLLALAGGGGAAARFLVDSWVTRRVRASVPVGTLVVNLGACFLIGLVAGWALRQDGSAVPGILGTGFLGGYSTFSTASVEGARLLLAGRLWEAAAHAGGMLVGGLAAAALGLALAGM